MKSDVVWSVLGKVNQSNARFGLTDSLEVYLDHVMMPVGKSNGGDKTVLGSLEYNQEEYRRCEGGCSVFYVCILYRYGPD
jgi:hypothetical protein